MAGGNAAASAYHARHLQDSPLRVGHLLQNQKSEHGIEGSVSKGEGFHPAAPKLCTRVADGLPSERHVGWDRVDTDNADFSAGRQQRGAQASRAAADIEDALSILDPGKLDE